MTAFLMALVLATSLGVAEPIQHPTPQEIQDLVEATMAVNPWPANALPPGVTVRVPLWNLGSATCVVSKWGNKEGNPACYYQICRAVLADLKRHPEITAKADLPPWLGDSEEKTPAEPTARPFSLWPFWLIPVAGLLWGFRRNIIPWAGPQIIPGGINPNQPPEKIGELLVEAMKKAGVNGELLKPDQIYYIDFIQECGNGLVGRKLDKTTYKVRDMVGVQVRVFGTALAELLSTGVRIVKVETGIAIGTGFVSDPIGGRNSLLPGVRIFRVYFRPGPFTESDDFERSSAVQMRPAETPPPDATDGRPSTIEPVVPPTPSTEEESVTSRVPQPELPKPPAEDSLPWPKNGNDIY